MKSVLKFMPKAGFTLARRTRQRHRHWRHRDVTNLTAVDVEMKNFIFDGVTSRRHFPTPAKQDGPRGSPLRCCSLIVERLASRRTPSKASKTKEETASMVTATTSREASTRRAESPDGGRDEGWFNQLPWSLPHDSSHFSGASATSWSSYPKTSYYVSLFIKL